MSLILMFKLVVVVIFLIMFLRRPSRPWAVGLLTVTSALLLDTILGTFDEALFKEEMGFFYYVIIGFLLGGAAYWLLGLLWPTLKREKPGDVSVTAVAEAQTNTSEVTSPKFGQVTDDNGNTYDLQLIYNDLTTKFEAEDLQDVIFDLDLPHSEIVKPEQTQADLAAAIIAYAQTQQQAAPLALAVERLLSPPTAETLPRLEKITAQSPRPILRYYLLTHLNPGQLQETAVALNLELGTVTESNHQSQTRTVLTTLYQQNCIDDLLHYLHAMEKAPLSTSDETAAS